MNFLKKIQNQPKEIREIILWAILVVVGIIFFIFWFFHSLKAVGNVSKSNVFEKLDIPDLQADVNEGINGIKEKVDDIENLKNKAEDILNNEEIKKILESEGNK